MASKVKMFIGTSANGEDAEAEMTYEYTLRENTDRELEIVWMRQTKDLTSIWGGWSTERWSTPFSGFRWAIPEVCNYEGRAIYTDVDMINFRDINELLETNLNNKPIAARRGSRFGGHEFCVMVFDCKAFKQHALPINRMKQIAESHLRMINKFSGNEDLVEDLDPRWNCLDGEEYSVDNMWQLHYTKMESQPWKPSWFTGVTCEHKRVELVDLWYVKKQKALDAGYNIEDYQPEEMFGSYNIIGR